MAEKSRFPFWSLQSLPTLPALAAEILRRVHGDPLDIEELAEFAASDPGIAARVLSAANSAAFGGVDQVDTVHDAVVRLGALQTQATIAAEALKVALPHSSDLAAVDACWKHSVACAKVCELTASGLGLAPGAAYTAGLLHDVGRLALTVRYPNEYSDLEAIVSSDETFDPLECERRLFEIDHCEAGDRLITDWNLPENLRPCVSQHHQEPQPGADPLLRSVRIGCAVASSIGFPEPSPAKVPLGDEAAPESILGAEQGRLQLKAEIEAEFRRLLHS